MLVILCFDIIENVSGAQKYKTFELNKAPLMQESEYYLCFRNICPENEENLPLYLH
jgi:hypothetical protein